MPSNSGAVTLKHVKSKLNKALQEKDVYKTIQENLQNYYYIDGINQIKIEILRKSKVF